MDDVTTWVVKGTDIPVQMATPFGNPITVFRTPYFYIDVLTWIDGSTAIHEHGFTGAFTVLLGSSIHTRYQFRRDLTLADRLHVGAIEVRQAEMLSSGDVRPIFFGKAGAHSLFHLDRPSLSIVVRTPSAAVTGPQHLYLPPSVAFDPSFTTPELQCGLRTLEIAFALRGENFIDIAATLIRDADAYSAFKYTLYVSEKFPLIDECHEFLDHVSALQPTLAPHIHRVIPGVRSRSRLLAYRRTVIDREDRFILGLLAGLTDRAQIHQIIESHYGREPKPVLIERIARMIGINPTIAPLEHEILSRLLDGDTDRELMSALSRHYELQDDVNEVRALISEFRQLPLLSSLVAR